MLITRRSRFTGKESTMDLPGVTQEQIDAWQKGDVLIQHAFPHLSPEQREFIMTGVTPEEWDAAMREIDEGEA